jgi:hypothetical protein
MVVGPRLIGEDIDDRMRSIDRAQYWPVSSCALAPGTAAESRNAAARSAPTAWRRWRRRARAPMLLFVAVELGGWFVTSRVGVYICAGAHMHGSRDACRSWTLFVSTQQEAGRSRQTNLPLRPRTIEDGEGARAYA